eukprot:IDg6576t1
MQCAPPLFGVEDEPSSGRLRKHVAQPPESDFNATERILSHCQEYDGLVGNFQYLKK